MDLSKLGNLRKWAFIVGIVMALIASFGDNLAWTAPVLVILGIVVGFLNVDSKETQSFLLAAIGLVFSATSIDVLPYVGEAAATLTGNIVAFIAPAMLVVALTTLFRTAGD